MRARDRRRWAASAAAVAALVLPACETGEELGPEPAPPGPGEPITPAPDPGMQDPGGELEEDATPAS